MKTKQAQAIRLLTVAMIPFFTTTCVNNIQEETPELSSSDIPIRISTNILCTQTRISNNQFEVDDAIGFYVLTEAQSLSESRYIDNMCFTCTDAGLQPDEEVFYPSGSSKCDFISYYPYQETAVEANESSIKIDIKADQSSPLEYSTSDFMTAKVMGVSSSKKSVKLDFQHKLCQLNIVLQLTENDNIQEIKENATVFIDNACTKASYDFDTDTFLSTDTPRKITPNGEWVVNEVTKKLTGKKILFIPQQTSKIKISLYINGRTFSSPLPDGLLIESNTSSEIILSYDSKIGISKLEPHICEWIEGNSKDVTLKEESSNVFITESNFGQTGVLQVVTESNGAIAEVCKEYLLGDNIDAQAIVLYPEESKNQGIVLQLLNTNENVHGGSITWDVKSNSFTYIPGSSAPITTLYANSEGGIEFEEPANPQNVTVTEDRLIDIRGTETLSYPIIKIGTQLWMGENLNTAKYNDGKSLVKITDMTKTVAGYFLKEDNRFYNEALVIKGTLAPKGWRIPNNEEWEKLKAYVNNTAAALKGGSRWTASTGISQANNKTGFNAQPIGFYGKKGKENSSGYDFNNEKTAYWNMANSQTTLSEICVNLIFNDNAIKGALHNEYSGYSIRCIKE